MPLHVARDVGVRVAATLARPRIFVEVTNLREELRRDRGARQLRPTHRGAGRLRIGRVDDDLRRRRVAAAQVARVPEYAAVPFYMFTGFLGERFAVCFLHGAFIAYAVRQLAERRSFLDSALPDPGSPP